MTITHCAPRDAQQDEPSQTSCTKGACGITQLSKAQRIQKNPSAAMASVAASLTGKPWRESVVLMRDCDSSNPWVLGNSRPNLPLTPARPPELCGGGSRIIWSNGVFCPGLVGAIPCHWMPVTNLFQKRDGICVTGRARSVGEVQIANPTSGTERRAMHCALSNGNNTGPRLVDLVCRLQNCFQGNF